MVNQGANMTEKKVLRIRILIAITIFIISSWIFINIILKTAEASSYRWHPTPISIVLFIISFVMLANGVSYLSEILKKDKKYLKILTGIFSTYIFVFTFIPQNQDASPLIGWTTFIGLSSSSILVSVFSVLEWAIFKKDSDGFFHFYLHCLVESLVASFCHSFIEVTVIPKVDLFLLVMVRLYSWLVS